MTSRTSSGVGILVGRVHRPHGLQGEVEVTVVSENPGRFAPGELLDVVSPAGGCRALEIVSARPHHDRLLVRFRGIDDRDQALELRGAALEVDAARIPTPPGGSYYYFELEGCRCRDRRLGPIGIVTEVREDGGGLLLAVSDGERTVLVPFVRALVTRIDTAAKRIELELPAGLVESCASPS